MYWHFSAFQSHAQYFQNFDTLNYGDYIGVNDPNWTTWSGATGGSEDAKVDTLQANSGSNSIFFSSTSSTGGPQDAVLNFGSAYNTGQFEYSHAMFIEAGKGAYFNLQAETTIGTTWALNCFFIQDSMMYIDDAKTIHVSSSYPVNTWFNFKLKINLNTNTWQLYIDNTLHSTWQNDVNKVASVDYYPLCESSLGGNGQAKFWLDDVAFSHTPYTLPTLNAGVAGISFEKVTIAGGTNNAIVQVRNLGTTTITSMDVDVTYNGSTFHESLTNLNMASLDFHTFTLGQSLSLVQGVDSIEATIISVNGVTGDGDANDDNKMYHFSTIVPAPGKMVIVEEATGTWCGWCPRGTVAMAFLKRDYHGFAQGIAVHGGDIMEEDSIYKPGINSLVSGYPSALVNRGGDIDPSSIWSYVHEEMVIPPTATLENGAKYGSSNEVLEVSITAHFQGAATSDWKLACALIEDSVTGKTSDYNQANYYNGGSNGDLIMPDGTNWATLPGTVPANQMVYNEVARAIAPSFTGYAGSFPSGANTGESHTVNFVFYLDPAWNANKMHIVAMLIKADGTIDNGSSSTIADAITNGYTDGINVSISKNLSNSEIELFPNPFNDYFTIDLKKQYEQASVEVYNNMGQIVMEESLSGQTNQARIHFNAPAGLYLVKVINKNEVLRVFKVVKQ